MENIEIWNYLNKYYDGNGIGYICCLPANVYSHKIYYYDEIYVKDDLHKIVDYSYDLFIKNGYRPDMYEIQIICSSSLVFPLSTREFVSCLYMLDLGKCQIINSIKDINNDYEYDYDGRVIFVCLHKN